MIRFKPRKDKPLKLYRNPLFVAEDWRNRMQERGLSRAELAHELGVTRARVSQMLKILKLPEEVLAKVRDHGDPMDTVCDGENAQE
jgi:ribosome-binding protein aMBF1 (putative translation factor)